MSNKMSRMNISLTKEQIAILKALAGREERGYSKQLVYMMNFYLDQHPELKKYIEENVKK